MPSGLSNTCAIAIMAKAPQAGRTKTRLVPPLTPDQAAAMGGAFLRDATDNLALAAQGLDAQGFAAQGFAAQGSSIGRFVAYAPAGLEMLFHGHLAPGTRLLLADGGAEMPEGVAGFGRCLLHAVQALLAAGYGAACVLNSDSPTLPTATLRQTVEALLRPGDRVVLGPAEDGGYYLLGVKAPHASLFADIAWSTDAVAAQTRRQARRLGLEVVELPVWFDVDDGAALRRLLDGNGPADAYAAPVTMACMRRLGLAALVE